MNQNITKHRISLFGLLPFLALIVSSLPLLTLKYPHGHDWIFDLVRVAEFKSAIVNGQYPPFWSENLYGGFGSPIFLFYAPLYMLVSAFCSVLTGSIARGSTLAILIFSLVAVFSMKLVLQTALERKSFVDEAASRIAVFFFILNPYLISDKLIRNANAEYAALCLSPLAIYGLLSIDRKPIRGGLILSAGLALIIIAHNLTALVIMALILVAAFVLYLPKKKSIWIMLVLSIGLGLGLSAFFWVPAISYKSLVQMNQLVSGKFDFHNQYQPLSSFFGYDHFFAVGPLTPVILLSAVIILWLAYSRKDLDQRKLVLFAFVCSLLFLFLQTKASMFIWEKVPFLPLFQFPWRMMGPLGLLTSIIAGLSFAYLFKEKPKQIVIIAEITLLVLCILNAIPTLRSNKPLQEKTLDQLPYMLKEKSIRYNRLYATVLDEYLPRNADTAIWRAKGNEARPVFSNTPNIFVKVIKNTGTNIILETHNTRPTRLQLARWFFPDWSCTVNGDEHTIQLNQFGTFDISIPAGFNQIVLQLQPPLLRRVTSCISIVNFTVWCIILILLTIRHFRIHKRPSLVDR